MSVKRAAAQIAALMRRLILRLRFRLATTLPIGIRHTAPAPCGLALPASSLRGRAHDPGSPCMAVLLEQHERAPRIGEASRALTRAQWA